MITGTFALSSTLCTSECPPRGIRQSTYCVSCITSVAVVVRSVFDEDHARLRADRSWPSASRNTFAIAMFDWSALDEPRSNAALPDLMHSAGGVARDVGPVLVDDRHDAERHAHPRDLEPVRTLPAVEHFADRIGQRRDGPQPGCHRLEPGIGEPEPVEGDRVHARGAGRRRGRVVRRLDLGRPLEQQVGRGQQRRVLDRRRRRREDPARRLARRRPELLDRRGRSVRQRLSLDRPVKSARCPPVVSASPRRDRAQRRRADGYGRTTRSSAVDDLVRKSVGEIGGALPRDCSQLVRGVARDPLGEHAAVVADDLDRRIGVEAAVDVAHTRREQRAPAVDERSLRARRRRRPGRRRPARTRSRACAPTTVARAARTTCRPAAPRSRRR